MTTTTTLLPTIADAIAVQRRVPILSVAILERAVKRTVDGTEPLRSLPDLAGRSHVLVPAGQWTALERRRLVRTWGATSLDPHARTSLNVTAAGFILCAGRTEPRPVPDRVASALCALHTARGLAYDVELIVAETLGKWLADRPQLAELGRPLEPLEASVAKALQAILTRRGYVYPQLVW